MVYDPFRESESLDNQFLNLIAGNTMDERDG